ncbi:MAG: hypothetical protein M3N07_03560 [Pseudomonadota bacterium]|nr:hypothetical protein [Pseudomonadota bacterium]
MGRSIAGLVVGVLAGFAAMLVVAWLGGLFYPIPVDPQIPDPVRRVAEAFPAAPLGAKLFVAASWFAGGFAGGAVGRWLSGSRGIALAAGAVLSLAAIANAFVLPLPAWMQIAAVVLPLAGGIVANHLPAGRAERRTAG